MWLYTAEILFDKSFSIGVLVNWISLIIQSSLLPQVLAELQGKIYLFFAAVSLFLSIFAIFVIKETKGRSEVEMKNLYNPDFLPIKH